MIGIILAGGKSRRFKNSKSKVFYEFNGKRLIEHVIDAMRDNVDKIIVVGNDNEEFKTLKNIEFIEQKEALGTGHALLITESLADDDLLISYADKPLVTGKTFRKLIKNFKDCDVLIGTALLEEETKKGRIIRENGEFIKIKEFKDASEEERKIKEVNTGFLIAKKNVFDYLRKLKNDNMSKEYYLTDIYEMYVRDGLRVKTLLIDGKESLDVNTIEDFG